MSQQLPTIALLLIERWPEAQFAVEKVKTQTLNRFAECAAIQLQLKHHRVMGDRGERGGNMNV